MAVAHPPAAADDPTGLHASATAKAMIRLIPVLGLLYFMAYLDRTSVALAKDDLGADVGLGAAAFGLGAGLFFVTYALLEVPSNLMMYRVGPRLWIARIAVSWGFVTLLSMFIQGPATFYLLRLLLGATEAGLFPAIMFMMTQWFAHKDRGVAVGYIYLAPALAALLGSPGVGGLMELDGRWGLYGWQWMFLVIGAITMILGVIALRVLPSGPAQARWLSPDEARALTDRAVGTQEGSHHRLRGNIGRAFGQASILLIALYYFLNQVASLGLTYNVPSIIAKLGVQGSFLIGLVSGLASIGSVVGVLVVPRFLRLINYPATIIAALTGACAVLAVAARVVDQPAAQLALIALISFCFSGTLPLMWVIAMERLTGVVAAAGLALVNTIGLLGGFVGPYAFGLLEGATGDPLNGLYLMCVGCVLAVLVLPLVASAVRREHRADAVDAAG